MDAAGRHKGQCRCLFKNNTAKRAVVWRYASVGGWLVALNF